MTKQEFDSLKPGDVIRRYTGELYTIKHRNDKNSGWVCSVDNEFGQKNNHYHATAPEFYDLTLNKSAPANKSTQPPCHCQPSQGSLVHSNTCEWWIWRNDQGA